MFHSLRRGLYTNVSLPQEGVYKKGHTKMVHPQEEAVCFATVDGVYQHRRDSKRYESAKIFVCDSLNRESSSY